MTKKQRISAAEATDRHAHLFALSFICFASVYVAKAASHLVDELIAEYLDILIMVLLAVMLLLVAPVIRWKRFVVRKLSESERRQYFASDSFTVYTLKRARTISWCAVFIGLVLTEVLFGEDTSLSVEFYLQANLAIMLGAFAISFLILSTTGSDVEGRSISNV